MTAAPELLAASANDQITPEAALRVALNLLLFLESAAVERGGLLESARMNAADFALLERWNASGFVQYGRLASAEIKVRAGIATDHWCELSEQAFALAHSERVARAGRLTVNVRAKRLGAVAATALSIAGA